MKPLKRTSALPPSTPKPYEQDEPQKREQLRREIAEGCREMADIYLDIEREFHPLENEVHRTPGT